MYERKGFIKKKGFKKIKKTIKQFLKSNEKILILEYDERYLNSVRDYHRILLRNPFKLIIISIAMGICYLLPSSEFKNYVYKIIGMKIGKRVSISSGVVFDSGYPQLITIEDGVIIGTEVKLLTHEMTKRTLRIGRIKIKKNVVIGVRSIIRSGIEIGEGSIVAMNSVVNRDVKDKEMVGGVPIREIRKLNRLV